MLLVLQGAVICHRFHRVVEHCQSPAGAGFGTRTGNGGAAGLGCDPGPDDSPDVDRVHAALDYRWVRRSYDCSWHHGFHSALCAIEHSPAQRGRIDWVVLAFALLISILTGLGVGLAPALHSAKVAFCSAIREGSRGSGYSTKTGRLRDVLIVSELAFAVMLMVGAGLLLRTLHDLLQENPGFNPTHVIAANVWLPIPNDPKADPSRQSPKNF